MGGNLFQVSGQEIITGHSLREQGLILKGEDYFNYISGKDSCYVSAELLRKLEAYRASRQQFPSNGTP